MARCEPAPDDGNAAALADIAMGRTLSCGAIAQWLGGWHLGRLTLPDIGFDTFGAALPREAPASSGVDVSCASSSAQAGILPGTVEGQVRHGAEMPVESDRLWEGNGGGAAHLSSAPYSPILGARLVWTETAVSQCHHLRQRLARYGDGADARLAGALIAIMVELIVDGCGSADGIADLPLRPPLMLRILAHDEGVTILGLHWVGCVV